MKIIFNGDDLGYTMANTLGILEAYDHGVLRSTTALTNSKYIEEAAKLAKQREGLGIGVHLTLTLGTPLTKNQTLHDENGEFYKGRTTIWSKNPDYDEIYMEWKAQIERYIELFGKKPTHLDSHHSVHDATPEAFAVANRLAKEYDLPLRRYSEYTFVPGFYAGTATVEQLESLLLQHTEENIEIMCHPGYCDLELYRMSSYNVDRLKELDVLCNAELIQFLKDNNMETVHY